MSTNAIYLDYAATTPCAEEVVTAMLPYFSQKFGNAASTTHVYGWIADEAVKQSRHIIGQGINAAESEIVFTSGATESCNLAILGTWEVMKGFGNHIITCQTEHKAVLDTCHYLEEKHGAQVTYLPVDINGNLNLSLLEQSITEQTILIAIMMVNNETGVIHPIKEIGDLAKAHKIPFFCDATQALGKIDIDVKVMNIGMMAMSAHKIYGPKGVGALYVSRRNPRVSLAEQIHGGGHEKGMRSGTLNVPGIVGMAKALELCIANSAVERQNIQTLKLKLEQRLSSLFECQINGAAAQRVAGICNIYFPQIKGSDLVAKINHKLAVALGSACTAADPKPSHVLIAMSNGDTAIALHSIRISIGRYTNENEIDTVLSYFKELLN